MKLQTMKLVSAVGMPANVLGYTYIIDALEIIHQDHMAVCGIGKSIYEPIAERRKTTWPKVERCIRHAIEKAHQSQPEAYRKFFSRKRPVNSMFLATLGEHLRMQELERALVAG